MSDYTHENVPVNVRLKDGAYEAGLVIDGAFLVFASYKQGGFDEDVQEAKDDAAKTAADAPPPGTVPPVQP
jgi:hypothetical protein